MCTFAHVPILPPDDGVAVPLPAGLRRAAAGLGRVPPSWTVHPSWDVALEPVSDPLAELDAFLTAEVAAGRGYLPAPQHVLRALQTPMDEVRVLVVGQDPYPTPGHPVGLSFSVSAKTRPLPRSLVNIHRELVADTGCPVPGNGDLSPWSGRGVLLLNRVLTVSPGRSGSHRGRGWEQVTDQVVRALVARRLGADAGAAPLAAPLLNPLLAPLATPPLVAVLWGRQAQALRPLLGDVPVVESVHPSPLSASRGFFGSRPFSRVNELLVSARSAPIDWTLPSPHLSP